MTKDDGLPCLKIIVKSPIEFGKILDKLVEAFGKDSLVVNALRKNDGPGWHCFINFVDGEVSE